MGSEGGWLRQVSPLVQLGSRLQGLQLSPQDIMEFIFFPVVNEGCRVIAEGIVDKPADLDVATVMAMGFPPWRSVPVSSTPCFAGGPFCKYIAVTVLRNVPCPPTRGLQAAHPANVSLLRFLELSCILLHPSPLPHAGSSVSSGARFIPQGTGGNSLGIQPWQ